MDEGQASPVHTVPAPPSSTSSAREIQPFEYPAPRELASDMRDTNLGTRLRLINLEEAFSDYNDIMKHIENIIIHSVDAVQAYAKSLQEMEYEIPRSPKTIPQYSYSDLVDKMKNEGISTWNLTHSQR